MDSALQVVRDEVISTLARSGKAAANDYIMSLIDPDQRDSARVHLAKFLAVSDDFPSALLLAKQIENDIERIDALLSIAQALDAHHRLMEEHDLLQEICSLAQGRSEEADFEFLIAMAYERLGLRRTAITLLRRVIALSSAAGDNKLLSHSALWLARLGVQNEPEKIIRQIGKDELFRDRSLKLLDNIREFQSQADR